MVELIHKRGNDSYLEEREYYFKTRAKFHIGENRLHLVMRFFFYHVYNILY